MLFTSYSFLLLFLPIVLIGWWSLVRWPTVRLGFLAVASWAFYASWNFPAGLLLLPLLLTSTTVDYVAGRMLVAEQRPHVRKTILIYALTFNLALLAIFKYLGFLTGTLGAVVSLITAPGLIPAAHLVLPIGISFYTFNSMSYTIDIYRGRVQPAKNIVEYAAFVACFPHLIAGPIVRYSDMDHQLRNLRPRLSSKMVAAALWFIVCGMFKKLVIADSLAPHVDSLFAGSGHATFVGGWAAAIGYTFQLYFDFSGYSDMAVGLAMLLGFRFPKNFDSPYKSRNVSEFWRRWHISLSSFLRDYVFIPLGGSRSGPRRTMRNLVITMFLGGLWHGAAWVFVLWGLGHGLLLVIHAVAKKRGLTPRSAFMSKVLTFVAVAWLWVPFRAGSATHAVGIGTAAATSTWSSVRTTLQLWWGMVGGRGLGLAQLGHAVPLAFAGVLGVLGIFVSIAPNTWEYRLAPRRGTAVVLGMMACWSLLVLAAPTPFLYFQF